MPRILAQRPALETLRRALRQQRIPHAWIFHGPFGVGKFTTAVEFARLLLDPLTGPEHVERFEAPREGPDAALFAAGTHPDLHVVRRELAAASRIASLRRRKLTNIPLDLVREQMIGGRVDETMLDAPVARGSVRGRGKVFIVDEAELLEPVAQDALLKTLEEPPPRTWIVLVTTREHLMRPTVRSRCQRAAFAPLDGDAMATWAAGQSSLRDLSPAARAWLLSFADGSPGTATFALEHGVPEWSEVVVPFLDAALAGRHPAGAADALLKLVEELAKTLVKERSEALKWLGPVEEPGDADEEAGEESVGEEPAAASGPKGEASLAAAKRDAAGWLLAAVAHESRRRLRSAVESGDDGLAALRTLDLVVQTTRQLDDNVNLRNAFADLVALASAPAVATVPFSGVRSEG